MATVVALNAHPDDETLIMGGTLAKLAAAGHHVVLVVATDGMMHGDDEPNPDQRLDELRTAAAALGAADARWLGYADSGMGAELYPDPPGRVRLARAGVDEAAQRVAAILREERADLLVGYDAAGGYLHRDHLAVHAIARRAAALAGVRLVEATLPREAPCAWFAPWADCASARRRPWPPHAPGTRRRGRSRTGSTSGTRSRRRSKPSRRTAPNSRRRISSRVHCGC
ncbi:PIG-L deacetylase family protein [Tsukamurella sp. PLM1]|uniref:PIG-L deacetylase family protein n=1 Tax=Tsukamurella sp. PLM1 TaxID=2929795 RepID=UPI002055BF69|nr:PIG-L family deacetylase [Tsukamurella sp. PLM1]BDH57357.1 hypothetical protein MTP03_22960 [Tsukamurella sp. PLM1]